MNITITQDNSRIETLGSNGASIILKLYELAIDSNNTLTLRGNISTTYAYGGLVDYLNDTYGPDLIVNATNRYIAFADSAVLSVLLSAGIGDGTGITEALAANANLGTIFQGNTDITSFNEFPYFTKANTNPSDNAFKGCSNLTNIDLSQCTKFSNWEFRESGITAVNAPSLTSSGYSAFEWCNSLTNVLSLGSITSIPANMFLNCRNLLTVILPLGVTSVSDGGFENCYNLLTINGLRSVTSFGISAFDHCRSLNITTADILNAVHIDTEAFEECLLLTGVLSLPNLISIGKAAFNKTRITSITNLGSISSLPQDAFVNCTSLTSVTLPSTCTSIGNLAFADDSSLSSINLNNVTTFNNSCFSGCTSLSLTGSNILNAINIGLYAFYHSGLSGSIICPNLTSLGQGAFLNTDITSVDFRGSSITSIPKECFYKTSLTPITSIRIPSSVTYLGEKWINVESTYSSLFLQGFENVMSHATYNYLISNGNVITPMIYKGTTLTNDDPICIVKNESTVTVNSYYFPNVTTSQNGNTNRYGYLHRSAFTYISHINGMFTAGLMYFKNISTFGYATFYRCNITDLVINNTTVPSYNTTSSDINYHITEYDSDPFGIGSTKGRTFIGTVWVPDSAVSAYQASPLFSGLTIKGINTKTNGTDYDLPRYADFAAWEAAEEAAVAQGGHAPVGLIEAWM